jgi:ribosomal protein L7Ae-like RNA K-turn-binding protein
LTIVLDASLGVKPMAMRNKLIKICEKGQVEYLVVGSKRLSSHKFKIESISNAWDYIIKKGKVVQMTMDVTFSEYIK